MDASLPQPALTSQHPGRSLGQACQLARFGTGMFEDGRKVTQEG